MRLIDADDLLNELIKICPKDNHHLITIGNAFGNMILNTPTAYDIDNVVQELQEQSYIDIDEENYDNGYLLIDTDKAIEIVKRCGIDWSDEDV